MIVDSWILLASLLSQVATLTAAAFLFFQVRHQRRATEAQLVNELETEFNSYRAIFGRLKPRGSWTKVVQLSDDEVLDLELLAAFFEKLSHFVRLGVVDWKTLDLAFRHRFFVVLDNPNVRKYVRVPHLEDWAGLVHLEQAWRGMLVPADPRRLPPST